MQILYKCLKLIFALGVSFFTFLTNTYLWREYCPSYLCDPYQDVYDTYDYIIVGAGSAGSVVSLRLAEDPNVTVLVLEAGPTGGSILDVPAALPLLQLSSVDWHYESVPQEMSNKGNKNNASIWPRGKLVGGTGRLNNMIYARGHPLDFKEWYKNKPDYNYERDILAYFKKSENQMGQYKTDKTYHSTNGPLYITDVPFITELGNAILEAAQYLGFPLRDFNGKFNTGFMKPQGTLKNGARFSTGHFLLENKPQNLQITTNILVEKVLFKDKYEAYGLETTKFGMKKIIKARKSIIISAGTVETAKLLLLSGLGNKADLQKVGIAQIAELPVGENLQDHVTTALDLFTLNKSLEMNPFSLLSPKTMYNYIFEGIGPWTSIQCEAIGILYTNCMRAANFDECASKQLDPPDLQIFALPLGFNTDAGAHLRSIIGIKNQIWDEYLQFLIGTPTIALLPVLLHPKSRGYIKLANKNPLSKPIINPKYLTDPYDVEILIKGIELLKMIVKSDSMQKLGAKMYDKPVPGCEKHVFDSRDYWECYIRQFTLTVYHPIGTAKMGHPNDDSCVVDYNFKVKKVNKLFVADASVMPTLPSANTNAATVLIAEKAADAIKHDSYLNEHKSYAKNILINL